MNQVILIGRLTKNPEVRYTSNTQMAVSTFTVAIDRPVKAGGKKEADFPAVVVFGNNAENCERYLKKGSKDAVQGRIQTGKYEDKNGKTVYTTNVVADRVEFLEWGERSDRSAQGGVSSQAGKLDAAPEGFSAMDEDIPF